MCGLDASFKSVVGEVSWPCHTNTDYDENGTEQNYSVNDKFSLASAKEILGVSNFSADQSVQFDYFKDCSKQDLIKNNANWYLRTPDTGSSFMCDTIDPSGAKGMVPASVSCAVVPVCNIV